MSVETILLVLNNIQMLIQHGHNEQALNLIKEMQHKLKEEN
jgi:hypothetical protein